MAMTWDEVKQTPDYQKSNGDTREAMRSGYFADVVAPEISTEYLQAAKAEFDNDTKPTLWSSAKELAGMAATPNESITNEPEIAQKQLSIQRVSTPGDIKTPAQAAGLGVNPVTAPIELDRSGSVMGRAYDLAIDAKYQQAAAEKALPAAAGVAPVVGSPFKDRSAEMDAQRRQEADGVQSAVDTLSGQKPYDPAQNIANVILNQGKDEAARIEGLNANTRNLQAARINPGQRDYNNPIDRAAIDREAQIDFANQNPIVNDTIVDLKSGFAGLPGAFTGLIDIAPGLIIGQRPADQLFNEIGEVTGFQPSEYVKALELDYSNTRKQGKADITAAWDDETQTWWDVTKAYANKPGVTVGTVIQSLPAVAAGGLIGRATMLGRAGLAPAERAKAVTLGGAIGEGSMMGGEQMNSIDRSVDPRVAALASLATGVMGAAVGKYSGALASKMGIRDVDNLLVGGMGGAPGAVAMPFYKRIPAAMVQEGLIEEGTQTSMEQMLKNIAEDKPIMQGVMRATVEGVLAGSVMGGTVAIPGRGAAVKPDLHPNAAPGSLASAANIAARQGVTPTQNPGDIAAADFLGRPEPEVNNAQLQPGATNEQSDNSAAGANSNMLLPVAGIGTGNAIAGNGDPVVGGGMAATAAPADSLPSSTDARRAEGSPTRPVAADVAVQAGVTSAEVAAVQDIQTTEKMSLAMSVVGEKEFEAQVVAKIAKYRPTSEDQKAMLVEATAIEILAKSNRATPAVTPQTPQPAAPIHAAEKLESNKIKQSIEQLIKRRKIAGQFSLAPQLDIAITKAKSAIKLGTGKAADFTKLAKLFKGKDGEIHTTLLSIANALESSKPAAKKAQKPSGDLIQRIKQLGGINRDYAEDFGAKDAKFNIRSTFKHGGQSPDFIARQLKDEGYPLPEDDLIGGLSEMVRGYVGGQRSFKHVDAEAAASSAHDDKAFTEMMPAAEKHGIDWRKFTNPDDLYIAITKAEDDLNDAEEGALDIVLGENDIALDDLPEASAAETNAWLTGDDNARGHTESAVGTTAGEPVTSNQGGAQDTNRAQEQSFAPESQTTAEVKPVDRRDEPESQRRARYNRMSRAELISDMERAHERERRAHDRERTSYLTGLPNRVAFDESIPMAVTASADIDGMKTVNDTLGHAAGDSLIKAKADALRAAVLDNPGVKVYHQSGDEFIAQADTVEEIDRAMKQAQKILYEKGFEYTDKAGNVQIKKGVGFSYGTGSTYAEADGRLDADKKQRKAAGLRTGERDAGVSQAEAPGQGDGDAGNVAIQAKAISDRGTNEVTGVEPFNLQVQTNAEIAALEAAGRERDADVQASIRQRDNEASGMDQADINARTTARANNPENFVFGESSKDAGKPMGDLFTQGTSSNPVTVEKQADLKRAEKQVDTNPSEAQKEAGNYTKGHIQWNGLDITIENPAGSERAGTDSDGEKWSVTMPATYGYIKRTEGADGDHVDVYIGKDHASDTVYVIDQQDIKTGKFDEHKVMLGFPNLRAAAATYKAGFSDGKGWQRMGAVALMSLDQFKTWLADGDTAKPAAKYTPPAADKQGGSLANAMEKYDGPGEIATIDDLVNEVQRLIDEDIAPDSLQNAVDTYREEQAYSNSLKGRGDLDAAEKAFISAVQAAIAPAKNTSTALKLEDIPRSLKIADPATSEGQYSAREAMAAANQRVEKLEALKNCLG